MLSMMCLVVLCEGRGLYLMPTTSDVEQKVVKFSRGSRNIAGFASPLARYLAVTTRESCL